MHLLCVYNSSAIVYISISHILYYCKEPNFVCYFVKVKYKCLGEKINYVFTQKSSFLFQNGEIKSIFVLFVFCSKDFVVVLVQKIRIPVVQADLGLIVYLRMTLNFRSSCFCLPSARITEGHTHLHQYETHWILFRFYVCHFRHCTLQCISTAHSK